jgi:hypothetical protein
MDVALSWDVPTMICLEVRLSDEEG